jgi:beta-lactamase class A
MSRLKDNFLVILAAAAFVVSLAVFATTITAGGRASQVLPASDQPQGQAQPITPNPPQEVQIQAPINIKTVVNISGLVTKTDLPRFVTKINHQLVFSPTKLDAGNYEIMLSDVTSANFYLYKISAQNKPIDYVGLDVKLKSYLGTRKPNYGIYIYDLTSKTTFGLNQNVVYPPASLSKLPSVVLALRDIDKGKYSLKSTFPVTDALKHGGYDFIAAKPAGTKVSLNLLLQQAILVSSNTAHYHIHKLVLGGSKKVVPRTKTELGVQSFFLDPHQATAASVGKLLQDVYTATSLTPKSRDYLINLLKTAVLKNGIPRGLPLKKGVEVANKEGFLFGGKEGDTYSDAAIVYGKHTDYVLVILNNRAAKYPYGSQTLADISKIVYAYMDRP